VAARRTSCIAAVVAARQVTAFALFHDARVERLPAGLAGKENLINSTAASADLIPQFRGAHLRWGLRQLRDLEPLGGKEEDKAGREGATA
jgi:hypothetical protein